MDGNTKTRKENVVVAFAKAQLAAKGELNVRTLREQLLRNYEALQLKRSDVELSEKSLEHYLAVARLLCRLERLLEEKSLGWELWNAAEVKKLQSTGILLCDKASAINNLSDAAFLHVLRAIALAYPCTKAEIKRIVDETIGRIAPRERKRAKNYDHDRIRDGVGKTFLWELGCQFIATEAKLDKEAAAERGLKIDLLGWKEDGTICGVEIKTRRADCRRAEANGQFDRYAKYVNEMYIITPDEAVYNRALRWKLRANRTDVGVLLCNPMGEAIVRSNRPAEAKKEIQPAMLKCVQRAFRGELLKRIDSVSFGDKACTPAQAGRTVQRALEDEVIFFTVPQVP